MEPGFRAYPDDEAIHHSCLDFLPRLQAWDFYTVRLNGGLRFGGFPLHWRQRCDWFAPASVLHHLYGRLMTRLVQPRQEYSKQPIIITPV